MDEHTYSVSGLTAALSIEAGTLYVVATPLGNLGDLSARARAVLTAADRIAVEDTRRSTPLLRQLGVVTRPTSLHEHNEAAQVPNLLAALAQGQSIALISDAGTPLISDPGFRLVREAQVQGRPVRSIPGPSAPIAALSISGLPSDQFFFAGFLPAKSSARRARLAELTPLPATLIFFESSHRLLASLADMAAVLGAQRTGVIARELTKRFEQTHMAALGELAGWLQADSDRQRGEFVILISGAEPDSALNGSDQQLLRALLTELPVKQAARLAAHATAKPQRAFYRLALELKQSHHSTDKQ